MRLFFDFVHSDGLPEDSADPDSPPCDRNHRGRLHKLQENIALQRATAADGQLAQAERMVEQCR